jgi:hypothetical protein
MILQVVDAWLPTHLIIEVKTDIFNLFIYFCAYSDELFGNIIHPCYTCVAVPYIAELL